MDPTRSTAFPLLAGLAATLLLAEPAIAYVAPFTFDPAQVGLAGDAFSGNALKADEWSHIAFTSPTAWEERGYARITGALAAGTAFVPAGLNGTYTLYLEFGGQGDMASNTFSNASMTLYGVNGAATFAIDPAQGNKATVDTHGEIPVVLANSELIRGTTGTSLNPGGGVDFFADLLTTFTPKASSAAFFVSPRDFLSSVSPLKVFGNFYHDAAGVFFPNFPVMNEVILIGGDDTIKFIPEPTPFALFFAGLGGLVRARHSLPAAGHAR